jgi:hypothetical protein
MRFAWGESQIAAAGTGAHRNRVRNEAELNRLYEHYRQD